MKDECTQPRGNSTSFVYKAKMIHKYSNCLVSEKLHRPWEFGVRHFVGVVPYDAMDFVERNMDQLLKAVSDEEHQTEASLGYGLGSDKVLIPGLKLGIRSGIGLSLGYGLGLNK
eukprot:15340068-Ditylum_brightwellii.AAC.1